MKNLTKILVVTLVIISFASLVNTYFLLDKIDSLSNTPQSYDYLIFKDGKTVKAKNAQNQIEFTSTDISPVLNAAVQKGHNINIQSNQYSLNSNIFILNQNSVTVSGKGSTFQCNGYSITIKGDTYLSSQSNQLEGLKIVNGTVRIENSFETVISDIEFEDCTVALELANTNTWSEATRIENSLFNNSATASIAFKTPSELGTDSYSKTGISNCNFRIFDNQTGIVVEPNANFNDGYIRDVRMWLNEGVSNQTGLYLAGNMKNTFISNTVFESFVKFENLSSQGGTAEIFGINIVNSTDETYVLGSGVEWLGNYTNPVLNRNGKLLLAVGGSFNDTQNVPITGEQRIFQVDPLRISAFDVKFDLTQILPNEKITITFKVQYIDQSELNTTITFIQNSRRWLTPDEKYEVFPTRNLIRAIIVSAESNVSNSTAKIRIGLFGQTA